MDEDQRPRCQAPTLWAYSNPTPNRESHVVGQPHPEPRLLPPGSLGPRAISRPDQDRRSPVFPQDQSGDGAVATAPLPMLLRPFPPTDPPQIPSKRFAHQRPRRNAAGIRGFQDPEFGPRPTKNHRFWVVLAAVTIGKDKQHHRDSRW